MKYACCLLLLLASAMLPAQSPTWSAAVDSVAIFSSPQAADLNGDGVLDIVLGAGNEGLRLSAGAIALDGATGAELWRLSTRDQIYGTALFEDVTGDGRPEAFLVGRDALLLCVNGATGIPVWEFWPDSLGPGPAFDWRQFYNPQWIPDANADGQRDLLLSNGGSPSAAAYDSIRPPGKLCIVSASDGALIAEALVPDLHETYFSPILLDSGQVLFGTGGETVRGKLWLTQVADILAGDLSAAQILLNDTLKGFIPAPSIADLDLDGTQDLIVPRLNAGLEALRGTDFSSLWSIDFPGYENYVSPTIGQFTGGPEPDVFGIAAKGQWAFYSEYLLYLVDGGSGQVVWTDTGTVYQMSQANALDWDGDGWDEILLVENRDVGWTTVQYRNQFMVIDFQSGTKAPFGSARTGVNFFASSLVADLDGDQELEVVYTHSPAPSAWNGLLGARVERLGLGFYRSEIAWPGYMGRDRDGRYQPTVGTGWTDADLPAEFRVFPNPARDRVQLAEGKSADWELWSLDGRLLRERAGAASLELGGIASGLYVLRLREGDALGTVRLLVE